MPQGHCGKAERVSKGRQNDDGTSWICGRRRKRFSTQSDGNCTENGIKSRRSSRCSVCQQCSSDQIDSNHGPVSSFKQYGAVRLFKQHGAVCSRCHHEANLNVTASIKVSKATIQSRIYPELLQNNVSAVRAEASVSPLAK